jgi:ribonuclease-3
MELSNHERIGKALNALQQGLYPYVEQKMQAKYGKTWISQAVSQLQNHQKSSRYTDEILLREDLAALLAVVHKRWYNVFKDQLSQLDRTLIHELTAVRNQWAHQTTFVIEDTYRAVDSVVRLLNSIAAPQAEAVATQRQEILSLLSQTQIRHQVRPRSVSPIEEAQMRQRLDQLLQRLPFQNAALLNQALTNTTYKYENPNQGEDNQQLEFLGDALLTFLSGDFLYKRNPDLSEGKMTVLRSKLVDNAQLAKFATALELGKWMRLGRGEESSGGRSKLSLLSDVFEAVMGAYYLDSGIEAVRILVEPLFEQVVNDLPTSENATPQIKEDVKSWLQQVVLGSTFVGNPDRKPPEYRLVSRCGTDNNPEFTVEVDVAGTAYGTGTGSSKQKAEKAAAEAALRKLGLL